MSENTTNPIPAILQQALWIWPDHVSWDLHNAYVLFRKKFKLSAVPRSAPLFITADQSYQLYINGRYVNRGPARGFQSHWPFDEVDAAPFLRRGENILAVRAYNPGFSNFQYLTQGTAGLLVAAQWGRFKLLSDRTWKGRRQSGVSSDTVPSSMQLFPQEHIDARVEREDWAARNFNDSKWQAVLSNGRWNAMPWYTLEPRGIPLLAERRMAPRRLLATGAGKCAQNFRDTRDVTFTRWQEGLELSPGKVGRASPPVTSRKTGGDARPTSAHGPTPLRVPPTGRGRFRSYLLDFGKTVVGSLTLSVRGAAGGEIVDSFHVETLDEKTLKPHYEPNSWCRMSFGNRLVCRRGRTTHRFYHPFGFRYLLLTVRDSTRPLTLETALNWVGYPLQWKGAFRSSDRQLEKIWQTCAWTQQCCSLDAYVDTPWREQAQWWGDARVQAWNTFHLDGDPRLFRRGIHCIAAQTAPNGLTYGHAPTMAHNCILPDFTMIWMLTLWDHYWQTGSLEAFRAHQAVIAQALEYFRSQTDKKCGLLQYDRRYWLFLDWTGIFKEGCPAIYNLWLLLALDKLAEMYRLDRQPQKAREMARWARQLRAALGKLVDQRGLVRDGVDWKGRIVSSTSVHAQTLALMAGLNARHETAMLERVLLPFIREEFKPKVHPSAYWITYVFTVLAERGYGAEVLRYIRKRWSPMVAHGTTFENFEPAKGIESHSHAWSAHPLYHFMQIVGGIHQAAPAWKEITFRPTFAGERGGATVPSPQGPITSDWERQNGRIAVRLSLPRGVRAHVELPGVAPRVVTGERRFLVAGF